jgi:hypothetical protein
LIKGVVCYLAGSSGNFIATIFNYLLGERDSLDNVIEPESGAAHNINHNGKWNIIPWGKEFADDFLDKHKLEFDKLKKTHSMMCRNGGDIGDIINFINMGDDSTDDSTILQKCISSIESATAVVKCHVIDTKLIYNAFLGNKPFLIQIAINDAEDLIHCRVQGLIKNQKLINKIQGVLPNQSPTDIGKICRVFVQTNYIENHATKIFQLSEPNCWAKQIPYNIIRTKDVDGTFNIIEKTAAQCNIRINSEQQKMITQFITKYYESQLI